MSRFNPALVTKEGIRNGDRLRGVAKKAGQPFDKVAQRFFLEAAIRRIFSGEHAHKFGMTSSLKGGSLMFLHEGVDVLQGRGTSDIDIQLTGYQGTMQDLAAAMKEALAAIPALDDGVRFDVDALSVSVRHSDGVPGGSVTTTVQFGKTTMTFKCDVGFYSSDLEDTLVPVDYPSMLPEMPAIRIRRQPIEYAISDKVNAAVRHAGGNTRMRDFYDIYVFLTKCQVDDDLLRDAFHRSWPLYGTTLPESVDDFGSYSNDFVAANAGTWRKLRSTSGWAVPVPELDEVVGLIRQRLERVFNPSPRLAA